MSNNYPPYGPDSEGQEPSEVTRPMPQYPASNPPQVPPWYSARSNPYEQFGDQQQPPSGQSPSGDPNAGWNAGEQFGGQVPPTGWGAGSGGGYYGGGDDGNFGGGMPPQQQPPMNTLSIIGFILAFLFAPVGAILSHVARGQIKKSGERGGGLALAGIIIGWVVTVLAIVALVVAFAFGSLPWQSDDEPSEEATAEETESAEPEQEASPEPQDTAPEPPEVADPFGQNSMSEDPLSQDPLGEDPFGGDSFNSTADATDGARSDTSGPVGGDVNQAFCDALADYQQLAWELDYTDPSATDEYADAMERLADTRDDAEAEKVYRDFVGHLRDPLGDHDTQLFVASEALTEQVLADTGKCHSEGSAQ
ncbi:DUF4190 domain-containing protein [Auritidibacter ignavus]|uniref:DUF4190 domain-containing protein n=1 Tax=Auritidibacter ignavus TaxID=678932 RepID=UPI002FE65751